MRSTSPASWSWRGTGWLTYATTTGPGPMLALRQQAGSLPTSSTGIAPRPTLTPSVLSFSADSSTSGDQAWTLGATPLGLEDERFLEGFADLFTMLVTNTTYGEAEANEQAAGETSSNRATRA